MHSKVKFYFTNFEPSKQKQSLKLVPKAIVSSTSELVVDFGIPDESVDDKGSYDAVDFLHQLSKLGLTRASIVKEGADKRG